MIETQTSPQNFKPAWEYLTENEVEDFFRKYLALYGVDGGKADFFQIQDWYMGRGGAYPQCFQKLWPMPIGRMYGYTCEAANRAYMEITYVNNYLAAIKSYRKYLAGGVV